MTIKNIITKQYLKGQAFWDIVFEWEEVFKKQLNATYFNDKQIPFVGGLLLRSPSLSFLFPPYGGSFSFELGPWLDVPGRNKSNIIPCIVDFFIRKSEELQKFYNEYNHHKLVLVSSMEVKNFLESVNCPLHIEHLGLSLSDKYRLTDDKVFDKQYDFVLLGRSNKVLLEYLRQYRGEHPSISIIRSVRKGEEFVCIDNEGKEICKANTREEYMDILSKAKCTLYSTPGIDGGEQRTNGFNQVTPKLLEDIACGCNLICRYKSNPDTNFYEMEKYWSSIDTYEQFRQEADKALSKPFDLKFAQKYLSKHYTSVRVEQLLEIIRTL